MEAIHRLTPTEVPVFVALMAIRSVPALLRRRRLLRGPLLDGFRRGGFVTLREAPDELVLGAVGRFWQPSGGLRRIEAAEFRDFDEPGFAKAAFNFEIEPAAADAAQNRDASGHDRRAREPELRPLLAVRPPRQRADPDRLAAGHSAPCRAQ